MFGSERLTGALLDRLTHHVNILEMNGDSYRLNQSRRRKPRLLTEPATQPTLDPVGPRVPPARAPPRVSLLRARRIARGALPWTTGTSLPQPSGPYRHGGPFLLRH